MRHFFIMILCLLFTSCGTDKLHRIPEKFYQKQWCAEAAGQAEVSLSDGTRCDCITATHAVEFDFAPKWAEAIGQALRYSMLTGKRAGIVLILKSKADQTHIKRLTETIQHHNLPIDILQTIDAQPPNQNDIK